MRTAPSSAEVCVRNQWRRGRGDDVTSGRLRYRRGSGTIKGTDKHR